jgi:hypothetical membrane protein
VRGRSQGRDRLAAFAGIVGGVVVAVGSIATAVAYRGADAERFSPLNHFVSELGERAQSELAALFNLSLIVGGLCLAVFMSGLAASGQGLARRLAGGFGVVAGLGGALVGVFPMDHGAVHGLAASTFFNFGWIAVALASLDFVVRRDPRLSRWHAVLGFVTMIVFLAFLREVGANLSLGGQFVVPEVRPDVWAVAALEWLTIVGIVVWVLSVSVSWLWVNEPVTSGVGAGDQARVTIG